MNYQIVLFGGEKISITEEQNRKINEEIKKEKDNIIINGKLVSFKMIAHIEQQKEVTQETKLKQNISTIIVVWAKKLVSKKDWNDFYSKIGSYCWLGTAGQEVFIGLLIPGINGDLSLPRDCYPATDSELLQIQRYREANNIFPQPFEKKEEEEVENEETNNAFNSLRARLEF